MIVDTSALLAFFDSAEPRHSAVAAAVDAAEGPLVVPPYVVAELDYLLLTRHGTHVEQVVLEELGSGAWELATMDRDRLRAAARIVRTYADVPIGLTDASCIVLAEAYKDPVVATLDHRHFQILRFPDGTAPTLVP